MGCTSSSAAPASAPAQAGAPAGSVPTPTGMFAVTVPAGALPGSVVAVPTPTGQLLEVTIPAGAVPGGTFMVPAAAAAAGGGARGGAARPVVVEGLFDADFARDSRAFGLDLEAGDGAPRVARVAADSQAARLGVEVGAAVLAVDGAPLASVEDWYPRDAAAAGPRVGDEAQAPLSLSLSLRYARVAAAADANRAGARVRFSCDDTFTIRFDAAASLGLNVRDAARGCAEVESVREGTQAARAGVRPGARVVAVDGIPVGSTDDFAAYVKAAGGPSVEVRVGARARARASRARARERRRSGRSSLSRAPALHRCACSRAARSRRS